jgi:hypothetical protein
METFLPRIKKKSVDVYQGSNIISEQVMFEILKFIRIF